MAKVGFPMLLMCVICGITGAGYSARVSRAVSSDLSRKMAEASAPATPRISPKRQQEVVADLSRHRLTLVCPDPAMRSDLTYERALMPERFDEAAIDAINSDECRLRPVTAGDFGQIMHQ